MNILITAPFDSQCVNLLAKDHRVIVSPQVPAEAQLCEAEINRYLLDEDIDILICESAVIGRRALEGVERLKLLCVCRAGLNKIDRDAVAEKGIVLTNTPGRNAAAVAELVIYYMIGLRRHFYIGTEKIRSGEWTDSTDLYTELQGFELNGASIGFLGFGAVPREVAKRLAAFNVTMFAYDPFVDCEMAQKYQVTLKDVEYIFENCDFVSDHLPDIESLKGFVDSEKLELMKPGAFFINTGRAGTTDEHALAEAIKAGRIAGAAIDVFSREPLPADHPYLNIENIMLTPHLGGASKNVVSNHSRMVLEDIRAFLNGEDPRRRVR